MQRQAQSNDNSGSQGAVSAGKQAPGSMLHLDHQQQYGAPQQMQYQHSSQQGAPYLQAGSAAQQQEHLYGPWVKYYIQRVSTWLPVLLLDAVAFST